MRNAEFVVYDGFDMHELAALMHVFALARDKASALQYAIRVVSLKPKVVSSYGIVIEAHARHDEECEIDTLVIAGGVGAWEVARDRTFIEWLSARASRARRIASVSSAAVLLVEAGLADGRRIVIHWCYRQELSRHPARPCLDSTALFAKDGRVWTCASASAGVDMALRMVAEDVGREPVLAIAQDLTLSQIRTNAQPQIARGLQMFTGDDLFDRLHAHIRDNLGLSLPVARMAEFCGMSERTFLRRYREATGATPARAVEKIRAEAAADLLLQRDLPVKRVAQLCGFGSEETLRRSFLRHFGLSPHAYRQAAGQLGGSVG